MKKCFACLLILLLVGTVDGEVIQVTQSSGCVPANLSFSSLKQAIASSSQGDTIVVCPGTYTLDGLVVDKPLSIHGYKLGTAVLNLTFLKYIGILSDYVEVKNLTVTSSARGNAKAFVVRGRNIAIENITVEDGFQHGIYIHASENVTLTGVRVYEAEVAGVEVRDSSGITVVDSWILQESIKVGDSVALYNVSSSTFRGNRIYGIAGGIDIYEQGNAFYINSSSDNRIVSNIIRRVDSCFTFGDASSGNLFYDNYFDCALPCSDELGGYNQYNTTKTPAANIVGGGYIQGNYWGGELPYTGSDISNDGIGDTQLPYNASRDTNGDGVPDSFLIANGGDWGPLIKQRETSPPVVFSINLPPNYELSSCVLLNASVTSYNEVVESCTLFVDGRGFAMNLSQGSYISHCTYSLCPADFSPGYASYRIVVRDAANNTGSSELRGLNINATPAVIHIVSPASNAAYNSTELPLNVTSDGEITSWSYNLNGGGNVTFTPNTTITAQNGTNFLEVYALDSAGYLVYSNVSFTVDLTPPAMRVFSPANGTLYTSRNVTINATASEAVTWRVSLNGNTSHNVTLPLNISAYEGANHLVLQAVDRAGNVNASEVYFTVDTTPPYAVSSTGDTKVDVNSSFSITWTLYDNIAGGYYRVLEDGGILIGWQPWSNSTPVSVNVDTSSLGVHNYTLEFNDSAGWGGSARVAVTVVDPSPPRITVLSPVNGTYYRNSLVLLNATADRAVHTWLYSLNGSSNNSFVPPANISATSGEGYYLLDIWANSTSGVFSHTRVYFYVDSTPPVTSDDSPAGWQNAEFIVNLTALDNLSGVAFTSYSLDNLTWENGTSVSIAVEGNHTIAYYSVDNAGNVEAVRKTHAALDKTPPVISIVSPENRTYEEGEIPLAVASNEDILTWWYTLNGADNVTFTPNTTVVAGSGLNHLTVCALDRAGNLACTEVYFSVVTQTQRSQPSGGGGTWDRNRTQRIIKEAVGGEYASVAVEKWNIEEISIKPKFDLYYVEVTVEVLDELPEYIKEPPSDRIYMIFKVDFSTKAIDKAKIKFKVEKKWLKDENVNPDKVKLLHYRSAGWDESQARRVGGDDKYYIYEAEVELFSYFAVAGEDGYAEEAVEEEGEKSGNVVGYHELSRTSSPENTSRTEGQRTEEQKTEKPALEREAPEAQAEEGEKICGPATVLLISLIPLFIYRRLSA
jgi:PGF-pre-PGF domain-containing protein